MNQLQFELERLYGFDARIDAERPEATRALLLELVLPAGWSELASVWKGVQADLDLPAPAIAISGVDGLQLWFSLGAPITPSLGRRFLDGLRARYLVGLKPTHMRLIAEAAELPPAPPFETSLEHWSAFVAPDLASVFADTPWLDVAPNLEGQATLLRALEPIRQDAFESALQRLGVEEATAEVEEPAPAPRSAKSRTSGDPASIDAQRFLRSVMNDESAPLALRIEAAKALLLR